MPPGGVTKDVPHTALCAVGGYPELTNSHVLLMLRGAAVTPLCLQQFTCG